MTVETITVGPGVLNLGAPASVRAFASQCTKCTLTPKVDTSDPINVLSGEQVAGDRTESWTLDGTILQDLGAVTSLVEWLFTNRGTTVDFEYTPASAKTRGVRGQVQIEAVPIGGDVKTKPTSDFSFQLVGEPELFNTADAALIIG